MLEAKEVNFAYRRGLPVLNDIACTIGDGEFVALWAITAAARRR